MSGNTPFDCPRCGATLTMSERQGIEIDYCPQCRGVWLDRGELDKIIERAEAVQSSPPPRPSGAPTSSWTQPVAPPQQQPWRDSDRSRDDDRDRYRHGYHEKKRKGWLGELFD